MNLNMKSAVMLGALLSVCSVTEASEDTGGILLLDVSGSMGAVRTSSNADIFPTRCDLAKDIVLTKTTKFFNALQGDYLDVIAFDRSGHMESLTGGMREVGDFTSMQKYEFLGALETKLKTVSCNGSSTALGDALCMAADQLRENYVDGDDLHMMVVTDAEENSSQVCGGNNYIEQYVRPKLEADPQIKLFYGYLRRGRLNLMPKTLVNTETEAPLLMKMPTSLSKVNYVEQLKQLAIDTGGSYAVIYDDGECEGSCEDINNGGDDDIIW
ncbi:hypothetical protein [Gynuella sp.]|uniref:hypothetical protein n=1 Tax=Gynuella sp. TaxID=2969146 RepID=UPI003D12096C